MDARGWISIPLIASFNRVRQLTVDPSLVREVLVLSTVVEVRDDWVRMAGWEQFVLPNSAKSEVEGVVYEKNPEEGEGGPPAEENVAVASREDAGGENDNDDDAEDDEDEEVVFVMEREPERAQD